MRTTQNGADGTTSAPGLYPAGSRPTPASLMALATAPAPEATVIEPVASPEAPVPVVQPDSRADVRRSLRAARRHRRHIMVGCAVVIAVCVVLTLLIVGMARDRRPATQVIVPGVALGAGPTAPSSLVEPAAAPT